MVPRRPTEKYTPTGVGERKVSSITSVQTIYDLKNDIYLENKRNKGGASQAVGLLHSNKGNSEVCNA